MAELARHENVSQPLSALHIPAKRGIPEKYLVHILLQLKRAGLVRSVRGAQGGYLLARSPEEVTLHDIIRAIDGPVLEPLPLEDDGDRDVEPAWREVALRIGAVLDDITVRDILERANKAEMYYI